MSAERMRTLAIPLCVVLALLVAWERALAERDGSELLRTSPVVRLVSAERTSGKTIAALSLEEPGAGELLYVRSKGLWRCREAFGAIADEAAIQALITSFIDAQGSPRTNDPGRATAYGFGPAEKRTFRLHGPKLLDRPDRDVLIELDVGKHFDEGAYGISFVRERGSDTILEIDRSAVRVLAEHDRGSLPPMLDTRLAAGSLPPDFAGFRQFFVDPRAGESLTLTMTPPDSTAAGSTAEPTWTVEQGGTETRCPPWRAGGYTALWFRARYVGLASPSRANELGLARPIAKVTLVPSSGDPFEIEVGELRPNGEAWVWNKKTNVVMQVPRETHAVLVPDAAAFTDTERANPWEPWLLMK